MLLRDARERFKIVDRACVHRSSRANDAYWTVTFGLVALEHLAQSGQIDLVVRVHGHSAKTIRAHAHEFQSLSHPGTRLNRALNQQPASCTGYASLPNVQLRYRMPRNSKHD